MDLPRESVEKTENGVERSPIVSKNRVLSLNCYLSNRAPFPCLHTRKVGRIRDSYANPRRRSLGFA